MLYILSFNTAVTFYAYVIIDYACIVYIKNNWPGGALDESTLVMLQQAGLVWK